MNTHTEDTTRTVDVTSSEISMSSPGTAPEEAVTVEEFKISGDALVAQIRKLLHQGNIRRIIINNESGHTLIEIPLTVGVIGGAVGAVAFPVVAALGVIGAMVAHLTVVVERHSEPAASAQQNGMQSDISHDIS